jgi:precorrin-6A/cobalt-precorrin-6A reductase
MQVTTKRVLILGGTRDAADLAKQATALTGVQVITSLAGRTSQPVALAGDVRVGGFGGVAGLIRYLCDRQIDLLVDATHPFATTISWNAAAATDACNIPRLMLIRPAWQPQAGDRWIRVDRLEAAITALPDQAARIFLTLGKPDLSAFAQLKAKWFLMRMIEAPTPTQELPHGTVLLARGPFTLEEERCLLLNHRIDAIVSKNSGGDATYAKVVAARELGIPIVMIERPALPPGRCVADTDSAIAWLRNHLSS